jgi:hypothetical protein
VVHLSPELTAHAVASPLVNFVSFTGSVSGGAAVQKAAISAPGFKGVALEVGLSLRLHFECSTDKSNSWEAKIRHMYDQMRILIIQWLSLWMVRTSPFFKSDVTCQTCFRRRILQLGPKLLCYRSLSLSLSIRCHLNHSRREYMFMRVYTTNLLANLWILQRSGTIVVTLLSSSLMMNLLAIQAWRSNPIYHKSWSRN